MQKFQVIGIHGLPFACFFLCSFPSNWVLICVYLFFGHWVQLVKYIIFSSETIISWRDPEYSTELALSFQESTGCSYIWLVQSMSFSFFPLIDIFFLHFFLSYATLGVGVLVSFLYICYAGTISALCKEISSSILLAVSECNSPVIHLQVTVILLPCDLFILS